MAKIDAFFRLMNAQGASDLHLASGNLPALRIKGTLERVNYHILDSEELIVEILDARSDEDLRAWSETWVHTPGR